MRVAGNTHCHPQVRPAFGYLRRSAPGGSAQPEVVFMLPAHPLGGHSRVFYSRRHAGGSNRTLSLGCPYTHSGHIDSAVTLLGVYGRSLLLTRISSSIE